MPNDVDTITDEQIASIAQRLSEEGRKVSPVTVWTEARGASVVAVAAALQRWREARQPDMPEQQAPSGLPDDLAETLVNVARRLWTVSRDETERLSGQRLSAVSQRLTTALSERDEALAEFQKTGGEAAKHRQERDDLEARLRASEESAARLREEFNQATARVQAIESRAAMEQSQLQAVKESLEEQRRANETLNTMLAGKDEEIARIAQERDQARKDHSDLQAAMSGKDEELARIGQERDWTRDEHANLQTLMSGKEEELARIAQERDQARQDHASLQTQMSGKDEELARIAQERDEARQDHANLQTQMSGKEEELARIGQERDAARQEHAALSQTSQEKSDDANSRLQAAEARTGETLARVEALEAELNEARAALATEREASAARGEEASAQRDQVSRLNGELVEARAQVSRVTEEKAAESAELTRVSNEVNGMRERAEAAEKNATDLAKRLVEKEQSEESELASLQRQISTQAKANSKAYDELRGNAEQWVTYAKDLRQRLDVANEKILFIDARSTGEVALMRRLAVELERLKPDHELVFREAQQKLIGDKMSQQLAQKGYRYDPATAVMSKIDA